MKKNLIFIVLLLFALVACTGDPVDPEAIATQAADAVSDVRDTIEGEGETDQPAPTTGSTDQPTSDLPSDRWAGNALTSDMSAISEVTISINGVATQSDGNGNFELSVPRTDDSRYVVNAEKDGFLPISLIHIGSAMENLTLEFQPVETIRVNPAEGVAAEDSSGTQIEIAPNQLVDENGNEPSGEVNLNMYTYDLENEEMVGDMSGTNSDGEPVYMESEGAFYASFEDDAGTEYNLADGATAEISIPCEPRQDEVLTVWSYDPNTGLWVEEGDVTIEGDGRCSAEVSHFSYWNFDYEKRTPSCVKLEVAQSYLDANTPLNVRAVLQTNPTRVIDFTVSDLVNVLINLPNNTDVKFYQAPDYTNAFATANSGAAWGGIGTPAYPYDACNALAEMGSAPTAAITIGDVIHLENGYPNGGFLDTRGRIIDKSFFTGWSPPSLLFVSTNSSPDRDNGSGSWQIVSADGKANGEPLLVGDSIHLLNLYPNGGYLDTRGYVRDLTPYANNVGHIGVFTANSPTRDSSGSGTWIIESASGRAVGEPLVAGDGIHLRNSFPDGGYLDTSGVVTDNPTFADYEGQALLVFTNLSNNRDNGSGTWMITLSDRGPIEVAVVPTAEPTVAPPTTGGVQGQVTDAVSGNAIANAQVCIQGTILCATTDANGNYTISDAPVGDQTLGVTADGYIAVTDQAVAITAGETTTQPVALSPELAAGELRIVLTWGTAPSDLDSTLWLPSSTRIDYRVNGQTIDGTLLDLDDTDGNGPETITLLQQTDGTYTYAVFNYSGNSAGTLSASGAVVRVYRGDQEIATYTVPTTGDGIWWYVFTQDGATGNITEVNTLSNTQPIQ